MASVVASTAAMRPQSHPPAIEAATQSRDDGARSKDAASIPWFASCWMFNPIMAYRKPKHVASSHDLLTVIA